MEGVGPGRLERRRKNDAFTKGWIVVVDGVDREEKV